MNSFEHRMRLSVYWFNKASDLRGSAGAIWACMRDPKFAGTPQTLGFGAGFSFAVACGPVYQMLCGMALELLLKATLIEMGIEPKQTHNLPELWNEVGILMSDEQSALLQILSEATIWAGRYPVPKSEKHFDRLDELSREHLFEKIPIGQLTAFRPNRKLEWDNYNELWEAAYAGYSSHRC